MESNKIKKKSFKKSNLHIGGASEITGSGQLVQQATRSKRQKTGHFRPLVSAPKTAVPVVEAPGCQTRANSALTQKQIADVMNGFVLQPMTKEQAESAIISDILPLYNAPHRKNVSTFQQLLISDKLRAIYMEKVGVRILVEEHGAISPGYTCFEGCGKINMKRDYTSPYPVAIANLSHLGHGTHSLDNVAAKITSFWARAYRKTRDPTNIEQNLFPYVTYIPAGVTTPIIERVFTADDADRNMRINVVVIYNFEDSDLIPLLKKFELSDTNPDNYLFKHGNSTVFYATIKFNNRVLRTATFAQSGSGTLPISDWMLPKYIESILKYIEMEPDKVIFVVLLTSNCLEILEEPHMVSLLELYKKSLNLGLVLSYYRHEKEQIKSWVSPYIQNLFDPSAVGLVRHMSIMAPDGQSSGRSDDQIETLKQQSNPKVVMDDLSAVTAERKAALATVVQVKKFIESFKEESPNYDIYGVSFNHILLMLGFLPISDEVWQRAAAVAATPRGSANPGEKRKLPENTKASKKPKKGGGKGGGKKTRKRIKKKKTKRKRKRKRKTKKRRRSRK